MEAAVPVAFSDEVYASVEAVFVPVLAQPGIDFEVFVRGRVLRLTDVVSRRCYYPQRDHTQGQGGSDAHFWVYAATCSPSFP